MTPKEVWAQHDAWLWQRDQLAMLWAHFTAATVQPHTKKRVKAKDLYKPVVVGKDRKDDLTPEERRKRFEEAVRKMGPEAIPVK